MMDAPIRQHQVGVLVTVAAGARRNRLRSRAAGVGLSCNRLPHSHTIRP